jgi:cyclase
MHTGFASAIALISTATLALSSLAAPPQQDFSKVEIKVHKLSDSVYMLEGAGGNIGVSVGDDGIVLVDDQYAPLSEKIRAALKGISDKPLRFVINTHYHDDHVGGNASFQKDAPVIAHDNVRKRMLTGGTGGAGSFKKEMAAAAPEALPVVTFERDMTLHLNGEDIRALHFPSGHTDGDSIVYFPKSNVVHMGDDFVTYGFPFIDLLGGGSVTGMIAACESVAQELPADVKVIPGHGPVSTIEDVKTFATMLRETRATVDTALRAGKALSQLKQEKVLDKWQKYSGPFVSTDLFIEILFNDITAPKDRKAQKPK